MTAFEEFGVLPEIARAVDEMEWTLPTDVQAEAIPLILGGGDVLMAAETGSGKTGAFCLPILQITWETLRDLASGKQRKTGGDSSDGIVPWTMSIIDRGQSLAISTDGLRCQSRELREWHGARATIGVKGTGKYCYEATVTDEGLCRVGWSTQEADLDLGTDKFGFGFGGTGKKSNCKQFDNYGEPFGMHDIIGCMLDLGAGEVRFSKNGQDLGVAFRLTAPMRSSTFYPAVVLKNAEMAFNFGTSPLKHPPPPGYTVYKSAPKANQHVNPLASINAVANDFKSQPNAPQAIIIEPSRELADQTLSQLVKFKKYLKDPVVRELLLVGGMGIKEQMSALQSGVDIIVSTPGRLEDLINEGFVSLTNCRFFVLDEADGLLKQNHGDWISRVHKQIPKITSDGQRLQMIVCSATLHSFEVKKMADRLMHFPVWVDLKGEDSVPETVHHVVCCIDPQKDTSWHSMQGNQIKTDGVHASDNVRPGNATAETLSEAIKILKAEYCRRAIDEHKMDRAVLFCRTKVDCDNLEVYLNQCGRGKGSAASQYSCVCLHGDRKPAERKANLEAFKNGDVKFLISTDVAARGLDITGLPFIINVTLPDEKSNYVHRIGRVGRAERMGLAISLVATVPEKVWYHGEWCKMRGRNCSNTNLTTDHPKGCCIWMNEPLLLADVEEHLNVTIQQIEKDLKVPVNEFDGKVVYGQKMKEAGSGYQDHVLQLVPIVQQLAEMETKAQTMFLKRMTV